jgi:two-component system, chemotaxis family, response regulator Rcp1
VQGKYRLQKKFQILIVEDNPADVRLLEEVFNELCANVDLKVAKDGAEGLEMITRSPSQSDQHPDLVLLDLNLPKISGHELLAKIKKNPSTCRIPVIILTSSRAESDVSLAYQSHANAYLKKPNTLDGLFAAADQIKSFWLETVTLPQE